MAQQPLPKPPNTKLLQDPTADSIWRRWLEQLATRITVAGQIVWGQLGVGYGTSGQILSSAGSPNNPVWITTLPVAHGGTGDASLTAHNVLIGAGTSAVTFASPGASGYVLTSNGASADPTFQAVTGGSGETQQQVMAITSLRI